MRYKLLKEDEDKIRSNLYRRYSMVRCLALVEACRIVRFSISRNDPQSALHSIRALIRTCQDDAVANVDEKNSLYRQTFKMGNTRGLQR